MHVCVANFGVRGSERVPAAWLGLARRPVLAALFGANLPQNSACLAHTSGGTSAPNEPGQYRCAPVVFAVALQKSLPISQRANSRVPLATASSRHLILSSFGGILGDKNSLNVKWNVYDYPFSGYFPFCCPPSVVFRPSVIFLGFMRFGADETHEIIVGCCFFFPPQMCCSDGGLVEVTLFQRTSLPVTSGWWLLTS